MRTPGAARIDGLSIRSTAPPTSRTAFRSSACQSLTSVADGSSLLWCSTRSNANCSSRRAGVARGSTDGRSTRARRRRWTALLATAFPYDQRERRNFYLTFWEAFMMRTQGVRRTGSAALDLCYVACGRVDGFWEFGLRPWDVAAGALIVAEAGGRATNLNGSALDLEARKILATNGKLHRAMRETIAKAWPEAERREAEGRTAP